MQKHSYKTWYVVSECDRKHLCAGSSNSNQFLLRNSICRKTLTSKCGLSKSKKGVILSKCITELQLGMWGQRMTSNICLQFHWIPSSSYWEMNLSKNLNRKYGFPKSKKGHNSVWGQCMIWNTCVQFHWIPFSSYWETNLPNNLNRIRLRRVPYTSSHYFSNSRAKNHLSI